MFLPLGSPMPIFLDQTCSLGLYSVSCLAAFKTTRTSGKTIDLRGERSFGLRPRTKPCGVFAGLNHETQHANSISPQTNFFGTGCLPRQRSLPRGSVQPTGIRIRANQFERSSLRFRA
jgi:hypothetical protein